ncbi:hypothetical protein, partial [Haloarcula sp. CGMCC 1.2071]|uniref:hypothetical protein n=1 Tax=Haloarcula sp. CGMCC 1.2071 TaxID=3111454 RepID=UPI00300F2399
FRHESTYWEHIGHRWRGALALFDFQPQLSLSTIYYARAFFFFVCCQPILARSFAVWGHLYPHF